MFYCSEPNNQDLPEEHQQADDLQAALPQGPQMSGDATLFTTAPDLSAFFERGRLNTELIPGTILQGHFVLEERRNEEILIWSENTSFQFVLPEGSIEDFALTAGHPLKAILSVKENYAGKNEEGFTYIYREKFQAELLAFENVPLNPTLDIIRTLPANTGFIVEGEIISTDPVLVQTTAGHTLEFGKSTLPSFKNGVLEYETAQQPQTGDHIRFTAARTFGEADQQTPPVLHIPYNYQSTTLLKASDSRSEEYQAERVDRKLELIEILNAINDSRFADARLGIHEILSKQITALERGYIKERINLLPEEERPIHPQSADYLCSNRSSHTIKDIESSFGVSVTTLNPDEFSEFCTRVAEGKVKREGGREPSVEKLYYILREIEGEKAPLDFVKTHVKSMIDIARSIADDPDNRSPEIAVFSSLSILAHGGNEEAQMFLCDEIKNMLDNGEFSETGKSHRIAISQVVFRTVEAVHQAVAADKFSPRVLLAHEDTFHHALAAVFPHEGYGIQGSIGEKLTALRKTSRAIRAGYDLAEEEKQKPN